MPSPTTFAPVMKLLSPRSAAASVEPLESRIAPARLFELGVPNGGLGINDVDYTDSDSTQQFFVNTELGTDQISQAVGGGAIGVADSFYLVLHAGDKVTIYNPDGGIDLTDEYLTVKSGTVVAFFVDKNLDNEVQEDELAGLSLGKNVSFFLGGSVQGDIVTNLDDSNPNTPTIKMDGVFATSGIDQITIGGSGNSVGGAIIAGANIQKITTFGTVKAILGGSAINTPAPNDVNQNPGYAIDFFPALTGGEGRLLFDVSALPVKTTGASIKDVVVNNVLDRIEAGQGGAGGKGGAIQKIELAADGDGVIIKAGKGGDAGSQANAGVGGSVSDVILAPPSSGDLTLNSVISISGGDGGDGATNGKGGDGGSASKIRISYRSIGGKTLPTSQIVQDDVFILGGDGGDGKIGGKGGQITDASVISVTPKVDPLETNPRLQMIAGDGGAGTSQAGVGGLIKNVEFRNQFIGDGASALLQAGNGGVAGELAKGAVGGSISNAKILASGVSAVAGDGSTGTKGGGGGSISKVSVGISAGAFARNATFNAGSGGDGTQGAGGVGGALSQISVLDGDFASIVVNSGDSADGGDGGLGKGGAGGKISKLVIFDSNFGLGTGGTFDLRTGNGGDGTSGGGAGGDLSRGAVTAVGLNVTVKLGDGGDAAGTAAKGSGGKGGGLNAFEILTDGTVNEAPATSQLTAGVGGNGTGANGKGGIGGSVKSLSMRSTGAASIVAGDGGNGSVDAAPGAGGSIFQSAAYGRTGAGQIIAGDAGAVGAKPAKGGSITGQPSKLAAVYGSTDLTVRAGDGTHGGAGGSLKNVAYGSTSSTLLPTPSGTILVKAGDGSSDGNFVGAGGSITSLSGAVSSGVGKTTTIQAGNGGSAFESIPVVETIKGGSGTSEVQTIDLSRFVNTPGSTISLSFGSSTAPNIPLPTTAGELQDQLNSLGGVNVTVTDGSTPNSYVVTFTSVGDRELISGVASLGNKGSAGGSITKLILERGGAQDGLITIAAGNGGDAKVGNGAKGGEVRTISVAAVETTAVLRSIAAGEGGDGVGQGGAGGSVIGVDVQDHDIGVRTGLPYGYDSMGGIFAGGGGSGTKAGANGKVVSVTADAIASIVAGRGAVPKEAALVDKIYLNGFNALKESNQGILSYLPGTQLVFSFNGDQSVPVAANTPANDGAVNDGDLDDVEDILNAMPTVQAAGGVTVSGKFSTGYAIKFNMMGDQAGAFTVEETVVPTGFESVPGTNSIPTVVLFEGDNAPPAREVQAFTIDPAASFNITFGGETTANLSPSSTAEDVRAALEGLSSTALDGVAVTKDNVTGRFVVTFAAFVNQADTLQVTAIRQEVQVLDFYDVGQFAFNFEGEDSARVDHDVADVAAVVQNTLNAMATITAAGGVTVALGNNGSFVVTFNQIGEREQIVGSQFSPDVVTVVEGTATTFEVQTVTIPIRNVVNPTAVATANFVGGFADPLSIDATTFHFIDASPGNGVFNLSDGDRPIDGLIAAKIYKQANTNFIPEARVVDGVLYDFKNQI